MDDSNKTRISDLQMYIAIYYRCGTLDITQQIYHQTINKPLLTNSEPSTNNYTTYEHTNENEFSSAGRICVVPPRRTSVVKKLPHDLGARCCPEQQLHRTQRASLRFVCCVTNLLQSHHPATRAQINQTLLPADDIQTPKAYFPHYKCPVHFRYKT
jgi:hypothetical protein